MLTYKQLEEAGLARIRVELDTEWDADDMVGDMFNPKYNPDLSPEECARQEKKYLKGLHNNGVWGVVLEVHDGNEWEQLDSLWGIDDHKCANEEIRAQMEVEAVEHFDGRVEICEHCGHVAQKGGKK